MIQMLDEMIIQPPFFRDKQPSSNYLQQLFHIDCIPSAQVGQNSLIA